MKKTKGYHIFLLLCFLLLFVSGCGPFTSSDNRDLAATPYEETEFLMGTVVRIAIYNKDSEAVLDTAFDRIKELAGFITTEEDGEHSLISKINEQAGKEPVAISDDLYELIKSSVTYSEETNGSFDLTIGPLTNLWRIGYPEARLPDQTEIDQALALVDYNKVVLNDQDQTVFLKDPDMRLDLGAIAKGFITDEIVQVLKENDVNTAIIDLGGNLFVMGNSPRDEQAEWQVGIQDPFEDRGTILGSLPASDESIVTSGVYERFLEVDGKQYAHLMNPETGYPFDNELAGVSVVTKESIDGDGLSTSLFSKGLDKGLDFVNQLDGVDAIFITKDKDVYVSDGLKDFDLTNDAFTLMNGDDQ
ncbi:FAD:protein FMN transferase [Marinilactibacillus sp. Marseille-P9653]|uniref:FAD:protein FMN transferase n=1 Tax=Marinilactibacillus sp. Marseille-P9653 TaxID=2866583 RepID=UPI001CE49AF0|nr:FAD:protein FMN transferase [Marinilactibacillus sp. Marseille-P9653]